MSTKRIFTLPLITIIMLAFTQPKSTLAFTASKSAYPYYYAYGALDGASYDFQFIDPSNPNAVALIEKIPISAGSRYYDLSPSPNGQWITIESTAGQQGNQTTVTRLLNVASGQVSNNITTAVVASTLFVTGWDISAPSTDIIWSPNSQYLAFNMRDTSISPNVDIYLYSLADHKLTNLTANDREPHYRMAWSPDSTQIVTTAENCASTCVLKLETFNLTGQLVKTMDVTNLEVQGYSGSVNICQLAWSPGGDYVSFISLCFPPAASGRDVYLWSFADNKVTDVYPNPRDLTSTNLIWYDAQHLIISVFHTYPYSSVEMQTALYETTNRTTLMLSQNWIANAALNPVTNMLSFRSVLSVTNKADNSGLFFQRSPIQIGTVGANKFSAVQNVVGTDTIAGNYGCNLAWSPDGMYLATILSNDCDFPPPSGNPVGFAFLKNGAAPVMPHLLTIDGYPANFSGGTSIGWTVVPQIGHP